MPVRKAVIPAAGLGTRCLPLTKALPKELLPIYNRPALEVIADEAVASGVDTLVLITSKGKSAVEDHFDRAPYLESRLEAKPALKDSIQRQSSMVRALSVRQGEARGLGHAVGCGETAVGNESFAVMLPDDLIFSETPALKRLIDVHEKTGKAVVLLMEVPWEQTRRYGVVEATQREDGHYDIHSLIEKPSPEVAPSNLAIVGRYVFPGCIFEKIRQTGSGALGEIQLTDAMMALANEQGMVGVMLEGTRLDTGNPLGLLLAGLHYASRDPDAKHALAAASQQLFRDS
jgi:UTP--glucose-1-phosphate uridylyltransferase